MAFNLRDRLVLTRRRFLRLLAAAGFSSLAHSLTGCARPEPTPTASSVPHQSPTDTPAPGPTQPPAAQTIEPGPPTEPPPTATETLEPTQTPTATAIPDPGLFDMTGLASVVVAHDPAVQNYPAAPPFDPPVHYPEYPFPSDEVGERSNSYALVRGALRLWSPDGFGSPDWNPLQGLIRPGDTVLIKPNLVHDATWRQGQTTHPAFLRPVIDYVYRACGPSGRIILAEGPSAAGLFDSIVANLGLTALVDHLATVHRVPIVLEDLNKAARDATPLVDLGIWSELRTEERVWYDAHGNPMVEGGDPGIGRYWISPSVLAADVVISVPKLKVHCSGGLTVTMKNMIGVIPAWDGPYEQAHLKDCAHTSDVDEAAGKRGKYLDNDTIWRSIADLNRILLYADANGTLRPERQRGYLSIVDGIVAAEASQYDPVPRPLGSVIIGSEPVSVDAVAARVMGWDPRKLRTVTRAAVRAEYSLGPADPAGIRLLCSGGRGLCQTHRQSLTPELYVYSWEGHVEAADFDPPRIEFWEWNPESGDLTVRVSDPAGVAWLRVAYTVGGEQRVKALALREGTPEVGLWAAPFPLGGIMRAGTLYFGDALFNEGALQLAW